MKIAIIHQKYTHGGGMESYLINLLRGFLAQGDQVTLFIYKHDRHILRSLPVHIHPTSVSFLPRRWRRYFFWSKLNATFKKEAFDLSISLTRTACQDISVCGGTHLGMLGRIPNRGLMNRVVHDKLETTFENYMLKKVSKVIAHSKAIANELMEHYHVPLEKLNVLYPPIDVEKFKRPDQSTIEQTKRKYSINSNHLNLLFPAVGHRCKGLTQLLLAFNGLPKHYQLYIAGSRPRKPLPPNVHYVGYIKNLAPLYASVDYTILPSSYEAFGLVVLESLSCLTPVIISSRIGAAEVVTANEAVFLPNNQPKTLIKTIQGLTAKKIVVDPLFISRHHLTIDQHINAIKKLKS